MATLAHELRNPVGAIMNALGVLERIGVPDVQAVRLRELIGRQARHLTRLVEDVLDVTRLRHGKLRLEREPVDLVETVRQAVESLEAAGRGAHHTFREAYADGPVVVAGDATRLEQVVRNLLDNAVKYSPANTAIDVSVERAGGDAVLSVRDEGIGIESNFLPRLFEPFAQAERAAQRGVDGLGLGLPLVRAIVEEHGGTISAHSDGAGRGSRFVVRVPVQVPPPRYFPSV
jgi:signal transduction histidine kinase